jgi:hypothetical protein
MNTPTARKKITATTAEEAQRLLDIVVDELRRFAIEDGTMASWLPRPARAVHR